MEATTALERFGKRVREERRARGWTQKELAKAAGLKHLNTISRVERGYQQTTIPVAERLARALGVPLDRLLGEG